MDQLSAGRQQRIGDCSREHRIDRIGVGVTDKIDQDDPVGVPAELRHSVRSPQPLGTPEITGFKVSRMMERTSETADPGGDDAMIEHLGRVGESEARETSSDLGGPGGPAWLDHRPNRLTGLHQDLH